MSALGLESTLMFHYCLQACAHCSLVPLMFWPWPDSNLIAIPQSYKSLLCTIVVSEGLARIVVHSP